MTRSQQMARVRQVHTAPEVLLRRELWHRGLRYRVALRVEGTRPDLAFTRERVAVFVDGCFWHGCPAHYTSPRTRHEFWLNKLRANFERDRRQTKALMAAGWRVVRLWEHDVGDSLAATDVVVAALSDRSLPPHRQLRVVAFETVDTAAGLERRLLRDLVDDAYEQEVIAPRNARGPGIRR